MAEQDPIGIARQSVDVFSHGDWAGFRAALAPEAVYVEPATGRRVQGADQIVAVSQGWRQVFPDATGTISTAVASGNIVTLEITWEGTQRGELAGPGGVIPASGKRVTVAAVQVVTVVGGKITETHHYFDMLGLLQQLGAIPAPGQPGA
jgi:steroid delta-isomerase-like uncharacterized protein